MAGVTNSPDYPTTPGAVMPVYRAQGDDVSPLQSLYYCTGDFVLNVPTSTGYLTKVSADGTALIFSTFAGGSKADLISGFRLSGDESIYVTGHVTSPDFPGLDTPAQCFPATFAAQLSADGSAISRTYIVGNALTGPSVFDARGRLLIASAQSGLNDVDPNAPHGAIACVLDAANLGLVQTSRPANYYPFSVGT